MRGMSFSAAIVAATLSESIETIEHRCEALVKRQQFLQKEGTTHWPDGTISYIPEIGAHAGPSAEELHTFIVAPIDVELPARITHPLQLYDVFVRYQPASVRAA